MLDRRETNILRSALSQSAGPVAERLSGRLSGDSLDLGDLDRDERAAALDALDAFVARKESFGLLAAELAASIRRRR